MSRALGLGMPIMQPEARFELSWRARRANAGDIAPILERNSGPQGRGS